MLVAGTAATLGLALVNERRLTPAFVAASPPSRRNSAVDTSLPFPNLRTLASRAGVHLRLALAIGAAVIAVAVSVPALTALGVAVNGPSGSTSALAASEPGSGTLSSDIGGWEQSHDLAAPAAEAMRAAMLQGAADQHAWDVLRAMHDIALQREASISQVRALNAPGTLGRPSGYASGTVIRARITIYGCTGPGGGFCGNTASGIPVFEGAAACSSDLPFGTKLQIVGDPTGRVYECLDRGALARTWVDVFFHDTRQGMAWQSMLGGTVTDIIIVN